MENKDRYYFAYRDVTGSGLYYGEIYTMGKISPACNVRRLKLHCTRIKRS